MTRDYLLLYINGQKVAVREAMAFQSLSAFLRYERQATGTKVVCEEGDCGSCTVLLGRIQDGELSYQPVNSCIQYLYQLDSTHIITIEGLKQNGRLNAVQSCMVEHQGAQCGYCTPGFVVAMCGMFDGKKDAATPQDIKDATTGNLCRCTGYEPIIRAGTEVNPAKTLQLHQLYPSQEMLAIFNEHQQIPITLQWEGRTFHCPITVSEAVAFRVKHPKSVLVTGGTDISVIRNKRGFDPEAVLSTANLPGLSEIREENGQLIVGARVTLTQLEEAVKDSVPELHKILVVFGSPQIKNAGTLAGNIANGSPIGDTLPFLMVMGAEVELTGTAGTRRVNMNRLYKGYRTLDMQPDELITSIHIPLPKPNEVLKLYKVSKRHNLDISTFTAAFLMTLAGELIDSIRISYGGVGPVVLRLPKTEAALTGKSFTPETLQSVGEIAREEITPISDVRGSQTYRLQLAETILQKFYYEVEADREGAVLCR
jgi:xanthine dehydrogenase small subunit